MAKDKRNTQANLKNEEGVGFQVRMPGKDSVPGQKYANNYHITIKRDDGIAANETEAFMVLHMCAYARALDQRPFHDEVP